MKTQTEAWWHIGMSSASHRDEPGSNPGKGQFFRKKMNNIMFELLRCSYSHILELYRRKWQGGNIYGGYTEGPA